MDCPSCGVKMDILVEGIFQCPKCKKIIKKKEEEKKEKEKKVLDGEWQEGEYFHENVSLNKQYEIAEKGITIRKTPNRWIAVLICHNAQLTNEKYVRISWWKKSFYQHAGMFKIYDENVLYNVIQALKKIDENYDDFWSWKGKFKKKEPKTEAQKIKEKKLDIIKYRIIENRTCPNCQERMNKNKSHYECPRCGEIVILEGHHQPIFNIAPSDLSGEFKTDFPINFYLPVSGITVKWLMGEWKALVVIYNKENPNKKWLRFYWWVRDLRNVLKYGHRELGTDSKMGWKLQRGVSSPNLYDKKEVSSIIDALYKAAKELNWNVDEITE